MVSGLVTIVNRLGLHARAAARFIQVAKTYSCAVRVRRRDEAAVVNGKSIMSLMTLVAETGTVLEMQTDGPQEEEAFRALALLIEDRFGEAD